MPLLTGAVTDFQATSQGEIVGPQVTANPSNATVQALTNLSQTFVSKYHYAQDRVLEKAVSATIGSATVGMIFKGTLSDVSADNGTPTTIDDPTVGHFWHIESIATNAAAGYLTWTGLGAPLEVHSGDNIVWNGTAFVTFDSGDVTLTGSDFIQVTSAPAAGGQQQTITATTGLERVSEADLALTNLLNAYNGVVQRLQSIEAYLAAVQDTTQVTDSNGDAQNLTGSLPPWPTTQNPSVQGPTAGDARGSEVTFTANYIQGSA